LSVRVWEDRAVLARLKEKLQMEDGRLVLRIEQEEWKVSHTGTGLVFLISEQLVDMFSFSQILPGCLIQFIQAQEWQIHRTGLLKIPHFISSFQNLLVLDLSRNAVAEVPKQIGMLTRLRELLLSYNRIQFVPEELSGCESLERLELAMNRNLNELPDQVHLSSLTLSKPQLSPFILRLISAPFLLSRFVNFRDNPLTMDLTLPPRKKVAEDDEDDREMFGWEFMQMYIQEARKRSYAVLNMHCVNR
ncbi:hypothetical protein GOODEAATRI_022023, partial [Goodea atripinnis]